MKKLLIIISLLISSCQNNYSPTEEELKSDILFAPDRNLSVSEILDIQKIETLHFFQWDSIWFENHFQSYALKWEVYLDSKHIRTVEYYNYDNIPSVITVIDVEKWNIWQYSLTYKKYTNLSFPDTMDAFENTGKRYITSKLVSNLTSVGFENILDNKCHVVKDSSGDKEWIWVQHGLPIKSEYTDYPEGIKIKHINELKNIEINSAFPDSIYLKP